MSTHEERFAELPNGTRLCYTSRGPEAAPAVLLIAGLGLQLTSWPEALPSGLLAAGLRVISFDNRDAGRSTRFAALPHPSTLEQLRGRAPAQAYGLEDMAEDAALLLDQLKIERAHLLGMSMGGMIAQALACRHPARVASLVSVFSTTGHRRVGQPSPAMLWRMARAKRPLTCQQAVDSYVDTMRYVGDATAPGIEAEWAAYAAQAWQRNGEKADARAFGRQIGAILKSGDRTAQLRGVRAPTLVIHGDVDRLVNPSGGAATAAAIPGARLVTLAGMRHQIDAQQSARMLPLLLELFK